jgi:hypothetical protein
MRVRVDTPGGAEEVELDLSLEKLTMRESVRLEETLGGEMFDRIMAGKVEAAEMARPSFIRAMIYTKLKTIRPELELDGFDLDLEDLNAELEEGSALGPKLEEPSRG